LAVAGRVGVGFGLGSDVGHPAKVTITARKPKLRHIVRVL